MTPIVAALVGSTVAIVAAAVVMLLHCRWVDKRFEAMAADIAAIQRSTETNLARVVLLEQAAAFSGAVLARRDGSALH